MPTRIETLLGEGTLQRAALLDDVKTWADLAIALGSTPTAIYKQLRRVKESGRPFPFEFADLKRGAAAYADSPAPADKWPNVAAFDAAEDEPPLPAIPEGHRVRALSTFVDADGVTRGQWIKTQAETDGRESLLEAVRELCVPAPRIEAIVPPAHHADDDLLCVYPMGDPHFGASISERGDRYDLEQVSRNLTVAVDHLVALAPPARRAWLCSVGDTLHHNGQRKTASGTYVGGASTGEMFGVTLRTIRHLARRLLEKHEEVRLDVVPGNHDEDIAPAVTAALAILFDGNPRLTVNTSPKMHQFYRFGKNLLMLCHGHKGKAMDLMGVMAVDRAADWGETVHRRIIAGHVHHDVVKEVPGATVQHIPTLAPRDPWHDGEAYRSMQSMFLDVIHREHGLINRHQVGIEALR